MPRDFYLAAYDVSVAAGPARQSAARGRLRAYATGGQKSVFECLLTPAEAAAVLAEMAGLLRPAEDRFLLLRLDPRARRFTLGRAAPPHFSECFYQG
jgi:CRISPR-associated protein Cas2